MGAKIATIEEIVARKFVDAEGGVFLVEYNTAREYRRIAKAVGLMLDIRVSLESDIEYKYFDCVFSMS